VHAQLRELEVRVLGVMLDIEPTGDEPVMNLDVFAPAREDYIHLLRWR